MKDVGRIVIVGAGPAGLGAATRLRQVGYESFVVLEEQDHPGGLASSFTDRKGFTWDIGGHVFFGGDDAYTDRLREWMGPQAWFHVRNAKVWIDGRFVGYPIQQHVGELCCKSAGPLLPLPPGPVPFDAWLKNQFGEELWHSFFDPYNRKVWGVPLETIDARPIVDRVPAQTPVPARAWGDNATFRYPRGGAGTVWKAASFGLPIRYGMRVHNVESGGVNVRSGAQTFQIANNVLISTMPISNLVSRASQVSTSSLRAVSGLQASGLLVIGLGLRGSPPVSLSGVHWWYEPRLKVPYHRVTVLSGYEPGMAPEGHWSLLLEVCDVQHRGSGDTAEKCIQALVDARLIARASIVSRWEHTVRYAYPTPTLTRDSILTPVQAELESLRIFSIGRFGAWRYELGNMDQCYQQGVDVVDRLLEEV